MKYSHVFITRPRRESEELAARLAPLGLSCIIQPAFRYEAVDARTQQPEDFDAMTRADRNLLLIFTSPRAVEHGLVQIDAGVLARASLGAIGPATARALKAAGLPVGVRAEQGYTSEALLETLARDARAGPAARRSVFILAAPGGRRRLFDGIASLGWECRMLMVYRSQPDELDKTALAALGDASAVLSVWTSANAMKALSQRLPPAAWFRLCQGDWLVISERLRRLARAYGPPKIHLAAGPGNSELLAAIRNLA